MRRSAPVGTALAIAGLAAWPAGALAATVGISDETGALHYRAAPGERNDVRIRAERAGADQHQDVVSYNVVDSAPVAPGNGCIRPDPDEPGVVRCGLNRPLIGYRVLVRLGDRGDRATFASDSGIGARLFGGPGSDELTGGPGDDVLVGGPGNDLMSGAAGEDVFDEENAPNGADEMHGGSGPDAPFPVRDRVDYSGRRHPVRADLAGDRDDGKRGERDEIGADVERLRGGSGDDRLSGNRDGNKLVGGPGTDSIAGRGGRDVLLAGPPAPGHEPTNDRLSGGAGSDLLLGGPGDNLLDGGPDADLVYGEDGDDRVRARDAAVDQVHCGRGNDRSRNDPFEFLLSCERWDRYSAAATVPLAFSTAAASMGQTSASVLVGCREPHPASCDGTVQLELDGEAVSPEVAFSGLHRHRQLVSMDTFRPLPPLAERQSDLVVRLRSRRATGAPTSDAIPVTRLHFGSPLL